MKGQWCKHKPALFCQEGSGCGNCEVSLSMECPVGMPLFYCDICPYQKEGLCDYPYIGASKVEVTDAG